MLLISPWEQIYSNSVGLGRVRDGDREEKSCLIWRLEVGEEHMLGNVILSLQTIKGAEPSGCRVNIVT